MLGVVRAIVVGGTNGARAALILRTQTEQNGVLRWRILQSNSGGEIPQCAREPPSKRPTTPAATGLAALFSVEQSGFGCVGNGVEAAMRSCHLGVARVVIGVVLAFVPASPPAQCASRSPYSSARSKNVWPISWTPISAERVSVENHATPPPAPP